MTKPIIAPLLALLVGFSTTIASASDATPEPSVPPPAAAPPAAPAREPTPPDAAPAARVAPAQPAGQWVYTSQYGWLWMQYGQPYTYVEPSGEVAYMYVYAPAFGWRWLLSPWVIGLGPEPYWGVRGRIGFAWYAHPWFHHYYAHPGYARGFSHRGFGPTRAFHGGGHHR